MKLIISYHFKDNYNVSYPVLFTYNSIKMSKELLKNNDVDLIDIMSFLPDNDVELINESNKKKIEIDYSHYLLIAIRNLINIMRTSDEYDNSIWIGFQNIGSDPFFYRHSHCQYDFYDILKKKGCKLVIWMDDLHGFPNFPKIGMFNVNDDNNHKDYRLDLCDLILTPSIQYLININSCYLKKAKFYFYSLNELFYEDLKLDNWNNRNDKILLSGSCCPVYPGRNMLSKIYHGFIQTNNDIKKIISYLQTPGYDRTQVDFDAKTGLNYYLTLNSYKGAFFGYASVPLNFNLAKIIEILMCGTLGFFEYSPLLESELGLIKYIHYVPMTDDNGDLILDANYYLRYLNSEEGHTIALNGCHYVRNKFDSKTRILELVNIIKNIA